MFLSHFVPFALYSTAAMLLLSAQCQQPAPAAAGQTTSTVTDSFPYNLGAPVLDLSLSSSDLKEISAMSPTQDPNVFLTLSDERGEALFVDIQKGGAITKRVLFRDKGDFEGAEMVGNDIFCLESDGVLFRVSNWQSGPPQVEEFTLGTLSKDNNLEGLGFDASRNALLIACKENPESDVVRRIFAFDLRTHQLNPEPVYTINPLDVNALVPYNQEDRSKHFFSSSGVAVQPITQDIYVISTALKRLVVLDHTTGKIRYALRLEKGTLPQPEGICFDPAGNLYISSEGKGGEGSILKFSYRASK